MLCLWGLVTLGARPVPVDVEAKGRGWTGESNALLALGESPVRNLV